MTLNLAPEQHHEDLFKRILGGCQTVVTGLGTLRNKMSDAHGRAPGKGRPLRVTPRSRSTSPAASRCSSSRPSRRR